MKRRLIHPRVATYGGVGAALGTLVVGVLSRIHGLDLTATEGSAIGTVIGYAASFLPVRG